MILRGHVFSQCLKLDTPISILTPKEISHSDPYRVCYLLHPLESCGGSWLEHTLLPLWAETHRTVFVMPDGQRSFYTDMKYGLKYFSYVSEELPEIVRNTFQISAKRQNTAIIGASMGGYGALRAALLHPEHFGFCGAISPAVLYLKKFLECQREDPGVLHEEFTACFGEGMPWSPEYEIAELAKSCKESKPMIYLAAGSEDFAKRPSARMRDDLTQLGFSVTRESWEGGHDWDFFGAALKSALELFDF